MSLPVEEPRRGIAVITRTWVGRIVAAAAVAVLIGAAVFWWYRPASRPTAAGAPPPPEVGVVELREADVPLPLQYAGRVAGFRVVEIRSQVSGLLLKREFNEGAVVNAGDVLFRVDP